MSKPVIEQLIRPTEPDIIGCLEGCFWNGSSQCSRCGARLRCVCGCYVREDNLIAHETACRVLAGLPRLQRDEPAPVYMPETIPPAPGVAPQVIRKGFL